MQRWFLILMLVLLPLRGWSAQLMGLQMGMQTGAMHAPVSMPDRSMAPLEDMHASDMPADCPMHLASASAQPAADAQPDSHHGSCQACQLCMPLALLATEPLRMGAQHGPLPLPQAQLRFVSAELAQVAKPPIL